MSAHAHEWVPGVAGWWRCADEGCEAVGRRGPKSGAIRAVARDAVEAEGLDRTYAYLARQSLAEAEGWHAGEGREPDESLAVDEFIQAGMARGEEDAMAKRRPKRHTWTPEDEAALRDAVQVVAGDAHDPDEARHGKVAFWSAVAGRLLPDLVLSPDACRTRWQVLLDREREEARVRELARLAAEADREARQEAADIEAYATPQDGSPDAWGDLARRIASMEMEAADDLTAALCGLRADVGDLDLRVRAWEGRLERIEAQADRTGEAVAALLAEWRGR